MRILLLLLLTFKTAFGDDAWRRERALQTIRKVAVYQVRTHLEVLLNQMVNELYRKRHGRSVSVDRAEYDEALVERRMLEDQILYEKRIVFAKAWPRGGAAFQKAISDVDRPSQKIAFFLFLNADDLAAIGGNVTWLLQLEKKEREASAKAAAFRDRLGVLSVDELKLENLFDALNIARDADESDRLQRAYAERIAKSLKMLRPDWDATIPREILKDMIRVVFQTLKTEAHIDALVAETVNLERRIAEDEVTLQKIDRTQRDFTLHVRHKFMFFALGIATSSMGLASIFLPSDNSHYIAGYVGLALGVLTAVIPAIFDGVRKRAFRKWHAVRSAQKDSERLLETKLEQQNDPKRFTPPNLNVFAEEIVKLVPEETKFIRPDGGFCKIGSLMKNLRDYLKSADCQLPSVKAQVKLIAADCTI